MDTPAKPARASWAAGGAAEAALDPESDTNPAVDAAAATAATNAAAATDPPAAAADDDTNAAAAATAAAANANADAGTEAPPRQRQRRGSVPSTKAKDDVKDVWGRNSLAAVEAILEGRNPGRTGAAAPRRERELQALVHGGVPMALRGELWQLFAVRPDSYCSPRHRIRHDSILNAVDDGARNI
jgi:hypothetical protein